MTGIPANLSRVSTLQSSRSLLANLTRTQIDLLRVQTQIGTGNRINTFSDDAIAASAVSILQERLARADQRLTNLRSAENALGSLDAALGDASDLILEAKSIASDQVGTTNSAESRRTQAVVIDGILRSFYLLGNRETNGLYLFGGSTATQRPLDELRGGFRYTGRGAGLLADLDSIDRIPITLGGESAIGETSTRVRGTADLSPSLTPATRLSDARGARGLGITPGALEFTFSGGPAAGVDLSGAESAQDVADALTTTIREFETANSVSILGPAGVTVGASGLEFDLVGGPLTFADIGTGVTAADLGLAGTAFDPTTEIAGALSPRLTRLTTLASIPSLTLPLDSIRLRFDGGGGGAADSSIVDLSSVQTISDLISRIESGAPGVRVEINTDGTGINVVSEISGRTLAIEEVGLGNGIETATMLGIRSLSPQTRISDFNHGRGVRIVNNAVDPATGLPDPARDIDFRVTLGNGQAFDVDLRPGDLVSVQTLIDRVNDQFNDAISLPPLNTSAPPLAAGDFLATLTDDRNGLAFTQAAGPAAGGAIAVEKQNNSAAAEDLGLLNGTYSPSAGRLLAQDRATVRVNNVLSALVELRDALQSNDTAGITLAGEALESVVERLSSTRALVGVHANRVERATRRNEDQSVTDEAMRSQLQSLDLSEAAIRLSQLSTQLEATQAVGARIEQLSLLRFLG